MKKQRLTILIIGLCTFLLIFVNDMTMAAAQREPDEYRSHIRIGIEKSFNLDFPNASIYLQKAVALDPENPTGYASLAMINLFSYEMSFDENIRQKNQASMLRYVEEALTRGEKRIEKKQNVSEAYLAMALAKVAKVNWAIHQKRYLTMAHEATNIWEYLEKARENDRQNFDIYFLMGLFHYHIDNLPGMSHFLTSLIITSGDKRKGLQELEIAAQKGDLLKQLAISELSSDYLNFEKQPARALPLILELKGKFPNNYNFSIALGNVLSDLHRFDDAFNIARELQKNIQTGLPPYGPQLQPRHDLLMGRIFFTQADYSRAETYFQKALLNKSSYNARIRAWAFLRLGMISDVRKERQRAEEYYSQALDVSGGEGAAQVEAKKYLETPYTPQKKI